MPVNLVSVTIEKPAAINVILGQAHFIKTVEDLHEALVSAVPGITFGLAFCESSGPCLVRGSGTDPELTALARANMEAIGAGHSFLVLLGNSYPLNVLPVIRQVPEVCGIYCATANPVDVVIAETAMGRGILGVVDGARPRGIETEDDVAARKALLRELGYKL
jgi:adenosine/AMP kinase